MSASDHDKPDAPELDVWICDFTDAEDRAAFVRLMTEFAAEPTSGLPHLGAEHFEAVAVDLENRAGTLVLLAAREESEITEGVLVAFEGYTTFGKGQLFNVHDLHVSPSARGVGVASEMMETLADIAKNHGFAKITLEVAATNSDAVRLYRKLGYHGLDTAKEVAAGTTYFAHKRM